MKVGIAGAGLMGRLMAWQLLREGYAVTLFDRDDRQGKQSAAYVAAAMLAPYSEVVNAEHRVFEWGLVALHELWPALIQALQAQTGTAVDLKVNGSVVVAHAQDQSNLAHFNQLLRSRVHDLSRVEFADRERLRQIEPALARKFPQATVLHDEGRVDNWGLLGQLGCAIEQLGGIWHTQTPVRDVTAHTIVTDRAHRFDWAVDTRGIGAMPQLRDLRGVRGEVIAVQAPEVDLTRPVRLMHPRYQIYIAPKPDDVYVIGATEIESDSMAPITVRSSLELLSALYSVHSGFAEASIIGAHAHCRPAFNNNLPRIDRSEGLLRINGLYRHGYLLGPYVMDVALKAMRDHTHHPLINTDLT